MPLYEYYCAACRTTFEKLFSAPTDQPKTECKFCNKPAERKMSTFAFSFGTLPAESNSTNLTNKEMDIVVGKDAYKKHQLISARKKAKQKLAKDTGTGIVRTNSGYYTTRETIAATRKKES